MSNVLQTRQTVPVRMQVNRVAGWLSSFALAAMAGLAMTMQVVFQSFHSARLGAVLGFLLLLHLLRHPRFPFNRETTIYVCFVCSHGCRAGLDKRRRTLR